MSVPDPRSISWQHDVAPGALSMLAALGARIAAGEDKLEQIALDLVSNLCHLVGAQSGALCLTGALSAHAPEDESLASFGIEPSEAIQFARRFQAAEPLTITRGYCYSCHLHGSVRESEAMLLVDWQKDTGEGSDEQIAARRVLPMLGDGVRAVMTSLMLRRALDMSSNGRETPSPIAGTITPDVGVDDWAQIFDAVSDPISIVDLEYRVLRANVAYRRMFGLPDVAAVPHRCFNSEGASHVCSGCPLETTVHTKAPHFLQQERLVRVSDGSGDQAHWEHRVYQHWTYPMLKGDGTVTRVVEILKDVTEQERVRELTNEADALRRADQLKAELLGTVSHELRSPLTSIKGYADTLARYDRRLSRDERLEFLQFISEASDRLEDVINRILLLSQLESDSLVLRREPVDLAMLAEEALMAVTERGDNSPKRQFALVANETSDVDRRTQRPIAVGDPRRLREAIDTLVDNAVKFTREDGRIEIRVQETAASSIPLEIVATHEGSGGAASGHGTQRYVELIVTDNGLGIPLEHQPYIFDAFHRVDSGLTREVEGLGLGLAICRRIVALSNGYLWVESQPGAGSSFHMLLPALDGVD